MVKPRFLHPWEWIQASYRDSKYKHQHFQLATKRPDSVLIRGLHPKMDIKIIMVMKSKTPLPLFLIDGQSKSNIKGIMSSYVFGSSNSLSWITTTKQWNFAVQAGSCFAHTRNYCSLILGVWNVVLNTWPTSMHQSFYLNLTVWTARSRHL